VEVEKEEEKEGERVESKLHMSSAAEVLRVKIKKGKKEKSVRK
jgi:hypothetical protein